MPTKKVKVDRARIPYENTMQNLTKYPDQASAIKEFIDNSAAVGASKVHVAFFKSYMSIIDNGPGFSTPEQFENALTISRNDYGHHNRSRNQSKYHQGMKSANYYLGNDDSKVTYFSKNEEETFYRVTVGTHDASDEVEFEEYKKDPHGALFNVEYDKIQKEWEKLTDYETGLVVLITNPKQEQEHGEIVESLGEAYNYYIEAGFEVSFNGKKVKGVDLLRGGIPDSFPGFEELTFKGHKLLMGVFTATPDSNKRPNDGVHLYRATDPFKQDTWRNVGKSVTTYKLPYINNQNYTSGKMCMSFVVPPELDECFKLSPGKFVGPGVIPKALREHILGSKNYEKLKELCNIDKEIVVPDTHSGNDEYYNSICKKIFGGHKSKYYYPKKAKSSKNTTKAEKSARATRNNSEDTENKKKGKNRHHNLVLERQGKFARSRYWCVDADGILNSYINIDNDLCKAFRPEPDEATKEELDYQRLFVTEIIQEARAHSKLSDSDKEAAEKIQDEVLSTASQWKEILECQSLPGATVREHINNRIKPGEQISLEEIKSLMREREPKIFKHKGEEQCWAQISSEYYNLAKGKETYMFSPKNDVSRYKAKKVDGEHILERIC